jgi:hypothetical protein
MPIYSHSISYTNGEIFGRKITIPQFKKGLTYHVDLCYIPLLNEFVHIGTLVKLVGYTTKLPDWIWQ